MDEIKKDNNLLNGKGESEPVEWITVNGAHIPLKEGETAAEAIKKNFENKQSSKKYIQLPPGEYAELCSAIRTKHADKIPKHDSILYKNDLYVYNYNKRAEKILCTYKIKIEGNEEIINKIERWYNGTNR